VPRDDFNEQFEEKKNSEIKKQRKIMKEMNNMVESQHKGAQTFSG
jgi:hypothetical protein